MNELRLKQLTVELNEMLRLEDDGCPHFDDEHPICPTCGLNVFYLKEHLNILMKYLEESYAGR